MTESKPTYTIIYKTVDGKKHVETMPGMPLTINSEPLSNKQLHEIIISQSMTIDMLLGEVGRYREKNKYVCEWTGNYKNYHEITSDTLFRVRKTSCSDDHDDIVSVVDYTFCPNCGGRIKYIENS